jgi:hypothetical protein
MLAPRVTGLGQTRPRRPPPWRAYARRVLPGKRTRRAGGQRYRVGPRADIALFGGEVICDGARPLRGRLPQRTRPVDKQVLRG